MGGPIWFVTGTLGAGKTSVSIELCRHYPRALHLPVDDIRDLVCAGRASALHWTDETELQFSLARRAAARAAVDYADARFAVVIDDVVSEEHLARHYLPHLGGRPIRKVLLLPALRVALERNKTRSNKGFDTRVLEPHIADIERLLVEQDTAERGWLIVDNGDLTVEATVSTIQLWSKGC